MSDPTAPDDPMTTPSVDQPAPPKPDEENEEAIRLDPIDGADDTSEAEPKHPEQ